MAVDGLGLGVEFVRIRLAVLRANSLPSRMANGLAELARGGYVHVAGSQCALFHNTYRTKADALNLSFPQDVKNLRLNQNHRLGKASDQMPLGIVMKHRAAEAFPGLNHIGQSGRIRLAAVVDDLSGRVHRLSITVPATDGAAPSGIGITDDTHSLGAHSGHCVRADDLPPI